MPQTLTRVVRLDSTALDQTYYTPEGYLHDRPILTSTGIFEYTNPDGTKRRELRLPEEVFDPESLKSYRGKPVVITHHAGQIDKDNVHQNQIGTILSDGYQSGDDVRAEIMIHATDEMKQSGLKELSLGYNLDLEENPGVWNGHPYDAIQRNIKINHLALVLDARAGKQARLNIDSRAGKTIIKNGGTNMKKNTKTPRRADGAMSGEELASALEGFKSRRAQRLAEKADAEAAVKSTVPFAEEQQVPTNDELVQGCVDRRGQRDSAGDPETQEQAMNMIAEMDADIQTLMDIIDAMNAEKDFGNSDAEEIPAEETEEPEEVAADADESEEEVPEDTEEPENEDEDDGPIPTVEEKDVAEKPVGEPVVNADSIDKLIRERVQLGTVASLLNMDGIDRLDITSAKKAVIGAVRPGMRLDGKSSTYINAVYDYAVDEVMSRSRKDTKYQKRQMFNRDSQSDNSAANEDSARAARQRMIERQQNRNKEGK